MREPKDNPRYARLAADALSRGAADAAEGAAGPLPDRAATIAAVERALRARGRRRVAPWLGIGIAAAAAVALVFGWRGLRTADPVTGAGPVQSAATAPASIGLAVASVEGEGVAIESTDGVRPVTRGDRIAAGSAIGVPGAGEVLLALDTGSRLRVGASSRARITSLGAMQRFDLERGTLEAEVAKLPLGGRFLIATGDAEVEVRGTRFEVALLPEPSSCAPFVRTQVAVQEGVVVIRFAGGETRVPAGAVWPVCAPLAPPPAPRSHARPAHAQPNAAAPPSAAAVDPSTLGAQNDLFAAALAARRRGDVGDAIRWLDRLIARYPDGPLTDSAQAERRRLMEAGGGTAPSK
jgi:ferric-dicitrate binding protein FerR (iron transport regulator)